MKPHADTATCHHEAARLLAWYVNDTLSAEQSHRVAEHLDQCATCRADAAALGPLRTLLRTPSTVEYTPQAGFAQLLARIDAAEQPAALAAATASTPPAKQPLHRGWRGPTRWLAAAVVVQAVALGVMATALLGGRGATNESAPYQTLTSTAPATPAISDRAALRVVFAPTMTLADLQQLLRSHQLSAVAGPSEAGLYTLALPSTGRSADELQALLQRLRADPRVRFAEPVGGEPAAAPR